jgi:diguanylate cyclase (GGDEF)-like protein
MVFVLASGIAVGLSYVAVLAGQGAHPDLGAATIASIALPALVSGLVMTAYMAWDLRRSRAVEGEVSELNAQLVRKEIQIDRLSMVDDLTGLNTRYYFDDNLALEFKRAERFGRPLSLLLIELDDAAELGDRPGQLSKNYLLSEIGAILRSALRAHDIGCRYRGETLAILLPETEAAGARTVAEKTRSMLASHEFFGRRFGAALGLSVSQGIAVAPIPGVDSPDRLLEAADAALIAARTAGFGEVRVYDGAAAEARGFEPERLTG